ncbi:hypothetical protein A605_03460 [Corynebacterium halotolerans YIM 70093 = DSM 44683]|uniref:Uncharacterized protein n=1 Tax=Corynebacterium halotolerans YIM 70093 = DSM 44683 TaxID=1121362 RepID=M1NJX2_9CORY|nr:hypothetical protein A605_03460 [Corynebacterium halotolerans YIM 70093 = DSM 44683]
MLARGVGLYEERFDELADHIGREMGKLTRRGVGEFVNEHLDPRQRPDGCGAVAGVAATAARAPRA